jgi:hypothetical protein
MWKSADSPCGGVCNQVSTRILKGAAVARYGLLLIDLGAVLPDRSLAKGFSPLANLGER